MNNAFLLVPSQNFPINVSQITVPMQLPSAAAAVSFSLVTPQQMQDRPRFGSVLEIFWTSQTGAAPIRRGYWSQPPKDFWAPEEIAEGLPISGHAVGSPPGIVPHDVGPFQYDVEGSPAVNQVDLDKLPAGYDLVYLRYTILGGNNGSPVNVAAVVQAFSADGTPLEFV